MEKFYILEDLQEEKNKFKIFTEEEYKSFLIEMSLCEYELNKGYYNEKDLSTLVHLENMVYFKNVELDVIENKLDSDNIKLFLNDYE